MPETPFPGVTSVVGETAIATGEVAGHVGEEVVCAAATIVAPLLARMASAAAAFKASPAIPVPTWPTGRPPVKRAIFAPRATADLTPWATAAAVYEVSSTTRSLQLGHVAETVSSAIIVSAAW